MNIAFLIFITYYTTLPAGNGADIGHYDRTTNCTLQDEDKTYLSQKEINLLISNSNKLLNAASANIFTAKEVGDSGQIIDGWIAKAKLFEILGKDKEAIALFEQASTSKIEDARAQYCYSRLGYLYELKGQLKPCLHAYTKALNFAETRIDSLAISVLYLNLARLYVRLTDNSRAEVLVRKSIEFFPENCEPHAYKLWLINLSSFYLSAGHFSIAEETLTRASKICLHNSPPIIALMENTERGKLLFRTQDFIESEKAFQFVAKLSEDIKQDQFQARALLYLARIALQKSNFKTALTALDQCRLHAVRREYPDILLDCYSTYIETYRAKNIIDSLSKYQSLFINEKQKLFGEDRLLQIAISKAEFDTREKQLNLRDNLETLRLQQRLLAHRRQINTGIAGIIVLLVIIVVFLRWLRVKKRRLNRLLSCIAFEQTEKQEQHRVALEQARFEINAEIEALQKSIQMRLSTLQGIHYIATKENTPAISKDELAKVATSISKLKKELEALRNLPPITPYKGNRETGQLL